MYKWCSRHGCPYSSVQGCSQCGKEIFDPPSTPRYPDPEQGDPLHIKKAALQQQLRALQEALDAVRREVKVALHEVESMGRERGTLLTAIDVLTGCPCKMDPKQGLMLEQRFADGIHWVPFDSNEW